MSPRLPLRSSEVLKKHSLFGRLQSLRKLPKLATSRFYMRDKQKRGQKWIKMVKMLKKTKNNHVPFLLQNSPLAKTKQVLSKRLDWNGPRLSDWHCKLCCKRMARLMQSNGKKTSNSSSFQICLPLESRFFSFFQKRWSLGSSKHVSSRNQPNQFTKQCISTQKWQLFFRTFP